MSRLQFSAIRLKISEILDILYHSITQRWIFVVRIKLHHSYFYWRWSRLHCVKLLHKQRSSTCQYAIIYDNTNTTLSITDQALCRRCLINIAHTICEDQQLLTCYVSSFFLPVNASIYRTSKWSLSQVTLELAAIRPPNSALFFADVLNINGVWLLKGQWFVLCT